MKTRRPATIGASSLLIDGVLCGPGSVSISGSTIAAVQLGAAAAERADDVHDGVLTAGLIDVQVNGAAGIDFAGAPKQRWDRAAEALTHHGVTAYCPTAISAPLPELLDFVDRVEQVQQGAARRSVAQPLGAHLEGPFLAPGAAGAHPRHHLASPSDAEIDLLVARAVRGGLAMMTCAPEVPGAMTAIRRLSAAGVAMALGHTLATAEQTAAAVAAGASWVTHLFNAQAPLHHRRPGLVGHALGGAPLTLGLIVDLVHVEADVVRLTFAAAGGRVALVSDSVAVAGMPAGEYRLGSITIAHTATGPPQREDGTLAGSALFLDQAVRNAISIGIPPAMALHSATAIPANGLGDQQRGRLAVGCRADMVCWAPDWRVQRVYVGGAAVGD